MRRILLLVFIFILVIIGLSFSLLNAETVQLKYYFGHFTAPLSWIIILSVACGAALGVLSSFGMVMRLKREIAKLHRTNKLTEKEVANLRSLPIKEKH